MYKFLSLFIYPAAIFLFTGFILPVNVTAQEDTRKKKISELQAEIESKLKVHNRARTDRDRSRETTGPLRKTDTRTAKSFFVFAGNSEFAPYSYYTDDNPTGFSVDLLKILSASINKRIYLKLMPWEKCISDLKTGKIDGLIGAPIHEEREAYFDYSLPVAEIDLAIFVETQNRYVNSIKSLEGTVVAVHKESLFIDEFKKYTRIQLLETGSVLEALKKLKNREVTAVIAEKNVALFYIQQGKIEGLKIVGPPVGNVYEYALATRKGETELLKDINRGITLLEDNETLNKLTRKWFGLRLVEPFPWKMVSLVIGGITGIMLLLMASLWVISLNATVKSKTMQIQLMSEKMVEKDKLAVLGKLAGQIAHELRTPLSIINNSVFLLRKEGSKNREIFEKRLRTLEDKIKLSSNILESILSYSRVKAEMATTVSVKECVEEVLKDIGIPEEIERDISFEQEDFLLVFMDFHQLYSVLRNLVLNAVQAMGPEGKLTIKVCPSKDGMTINTRICDSGHGIMNSARNKIFNLFYSTKITGTGLGLPISKSIIEANDGKLLLEDTSEKGTCFIVKLLSVKTLRK
ncbi:MAG: transporter substrate-binding domain-containing protein [Candidatus Omnitrophota bacterium]|nr:transporter substrate-binding domain-containing protein [Candidatus Omnitrophota bacterium]